MFFVLLCLVTSISREFKQITTVGAATAAVTQKVWEENAKKHGLWGLKPGLHDNFFGTVPV